MKPALLFLALTSLLVAGCGGSPRNRCPEQQIIDPARVTSELYLDRAELTIKVSETGGDLQMENPPVFILAYSRTIDTATTVSITGENKQPVSQDSPEFASILAQVAADSDTFQNNLLWQLLNMQTDNLIVMARVDRITYLDYGSFFILTADFGDAMRDRGILETSVAGGVAIPYQDADGNATCFQVVMP